MIRLEVLCHGKDYILSNIYTVNCIHAPVLHFPVFVTMVISEL